MDVSKKKKKNYVLPNNRLNFNRVIIPKHSSLKPIKASCKEDGIE